VVSVLIKGIGFQLIQEILTIIFFGNIVFKFSIKNPISADIQIRFIDFVALESNIIFRGKHKFENFVLTSKEESWSPKIMSKIRSLGGEDTYSTSDTRKVGDIFVLSANISIRTPGTNRGLVILKLEFPPARCTL